MTSNIGLQIDDKTFTLHETSAAAAEAAADRAEAAAETLSGSVAQIATNTQDITALKEDMSQVIDSAYVTDTASGSIASFPDGADGVPVKSLKVNVEPVQSGSGVPSPDNVRPISGHTKVVLTRTGKNLVNIQDKTITASVGEYWFYGLETDPILPGTYTISFKGTVASTTDYRFVGLDVNGNEVVAGGNTVPNTYTFTINKTMKKIRMYVNKPGTYSDFQLELGSTATVYEPYQGQSVTVQIGQTVYGGTFNVSTGELVINQECSTFGDLTWEMAGGGFYANIPSSNPNNKTSICSAYEFNPSANAGSGSAMYATLSDGQYAWYLNQRRIYVKDTRYSDALSFKTAMADAKVTYGLSVPVTIQLTANEISTVLGQNNIWADTGDVEVEYRADTKLYIKKLTGSAEDDMVADANIVSGQYFMVGNTLYKATANIASGGAITPNVNCTRKSLPEALNEINA